MDKDTKAILETVTFIKERMLTKEDAHEMIDEAVDPLRRDNHAILTELEEIREDLRNIKGYRREIDHALDRIAAIEKHLGIHKNIPA